MTICRSGSRESNEETERRRFADSTNLGEGCSLSSIAGALSNGSRSWCVGSAAIADADAFTIESISQNWSIFMLMGKRPIVLEKGFS